MRRIKNRIALLLFLLACTSAVYWPGMTGGFYFDDDWNILQNPALQIKELSFASITSSAISGHAGPLGRPVAMASFAINYFFSGFDAFYLKLTNLLIHLLSGLGVFFLTLCLARRLPVLGHKKVEQLALLVTAFWLLHPLNLTPVLYVVQRMTSLSALFTFWGLAGYVWGRSRMLAGKPKAYLLIVSSFLVFLPLGLLSKENAALLPLYILIVELVFFRFETRNLYSKKRLIGLFIAVLIIPGIGVLTYLLVKPEWILKGYIIREFNLVERLLTESRIVVFYLKEIILPVNSELGLFHDDIALSESVLKPVTTLFSILILFVLLLSSYFSLRRFPVYAFAVLFFLSAHLIESTFLALELVHEHRNYVASFSVLFFVAYLLVIPYKKPKLEKVQFGFIIIALFYLSLTTFIRANIWGNTNLHTFEELRNHPESPRINYQVGKLFATQGYEQQDNSRKLLYLDKASFYFKKSSKYGKSYTDGLFGLLMLEGIEGLRMDAIHRNMLFERLSSGPFNSNNYNYIAAYFKCIAAGVCTVQPGEVEKLIASCKNNAGFKGRHQKKVLDMYTSYSREFGS